MAEPPATSYDAVPYESRAFHEAHPDRLATLATLHGLKPPDIATARVLELGCAGGGNLIPMALAWPEARFLGIDLSARQVADGRAVVDELGLTNIELRAADLAGFGPDAGRFDYILCHGVYSWVPAEVRDRCLAICAAHLAPDGVAFVSYNTLPGWHTLGMLREMMLYHLEPLRGGEPLALAREARAFLDVLVDAIPDPASPFARSVRREVDQIRTKSDSYILHEHLEAENHPIYFREFVQHAARHGLRHLVDARYRSTMAGQPQVVRQAVEGLSDDPLRREQYLDFLHNRTFRRTLLVHQAREARPPRPEDLATLRALAASGPLSGRPDPFSPALEAFGSPDSPQRLATADPMAKAGLLTLCDCWPRSVPVPELKARALAMLEGARRPASATSGRGPGTLEETLLQAYASGLVDLHAAEPAFALDISARPRASPYARREAATSGQVTSLRHRVVALSAFDRLVLRQLDGTRDRPAVVDELVAAALDGSFPLHRDGRPIRDAIEVRQILDRSLEPSLARLRNSALLVG